MHWLNWTVIALLYALVGSFVGIMYALVTGADMVSFGNVVSYGVVLGPVVLVMIAVMRRIMRETDIPITRGLYHALIMTFAAPVVLYAAQLIAGALDAPKVARSFEVMKYWSIPSVFIVAVMYGIWRVIEGNRPRAIGTSGGSGGAPPSGTDGDLKVAATQPATSDSLPRDAQGHQYVACFSSRGAPFRLVRRLT